MINFYPAVCCLSHPSIIYVRRFYFFIAVLLVGQAWTFAWVLQPVPFSDWAYYWEAARGNVSYERGGVLLYVLKAFQWLGLSAHYTATLLNLTFALVILVVLYHGSRETIKLGATLACLYLLLIGPYFSVVQFDLSSTAVLIAGFYFLSVEGDTVKRRTMALTSFLLIAVAVSSRPQFLLVLVAFGAFVTLGCLIFARKNMSAAKRASSSAVILIAASLAGFAIDSALRSSAGRADAVRTTSGVTLYAGLLSSGAERPWCGHWSEVATRDAREDAKLPLFQAISGRLAQRPVTYWVSVARCKATGILLPTAYALSWSMGAPSVAERVERDELNHNLRSWMHLMYRGEHYAYLLLLLSIYGIFFIALYRDILKKNVTSAIGLLSWIAAFWSVHLVFEIQARYFLPLFLTLPIFATGLFHPLFMPRIYSQSDSRATS